MTPIATKQNILDAAGYIYNFDREVYFNRSAKKIFSVDFIEDHNPSELERRIREKADAGKWRFYFNVPPSESVKRQIVEALG
jgi:hypothetical protein